MVPSGLPFQVCPERALGSSFAFSFSRSWFSGFASRCRSKLAPTNTPVLKPATYGQAMPVIQSPETVFLLQLFGKYESSELCGAAKYYGIPEPMWPVSLQHGTDHFLPDLTALIALRLLPILSRSLPDHHYVSQSSQHADFTTTVVPHMHLQNSGADYDACTSTRTCTPSPTSRRPMRCTGSSK